MKITTVSKRLDILAVLSKKNIWGGTDIEVPTVIGLNRIHQDFSTDEWISHVSFCQLFVRVRIAKISESEMGQSFGILY